MFHRNIYINMIGLIFLMFLFLIFPILISNMLNIDKKQKLLRVLIIFSTVKGILRPISLKMTTPKVFL